MSCDPKVMETGDATERVEVPPEEEAPEVGSKSCVGVGDHEHEA